MTWPKTKLIFVREVRDQLRDRRTLFMIVVLPVLLYPALGLGLMQLTAQFRDETRHVVVVGIENLPTEPALLQPNGRRFDPTLFDDSSADNLDVRSPASDETPKSLDDLLLSGRVHAVVTVPSTIQKALAGGVQVTLPIHFNGADERSRTAYRTIVRGLEAWSDRIVEQRMRSLGRDADFAEPIHIDGDNSDVSPVAARSGSLWGRFFPFLIVMMTLTGAFYPAIDMCAGEKERGTMETLLITPASRGEIVTGKFLAILGFSVTTTLCNLISMGLTVGQISRMVAVTSGRTSAELAVPSMAAIAWMLLLMLPLAGFFSALCMALAVFARSTKEGQYYLMPLFLVVSPLIFITLAPGVQLSPFYSLVPVTNTALLLRALMLNQYPTAIAYFLPVMAPTILYAYLALRFALEQFNREEVLFREAERFELRLWIRHLLRDKGPLPTSTEAWSCYILMLLLIWYSQGRFPTTLGSVSAIQIAFVAFPAIVMSLLLTSDAPRTLALRIPRWGAAALALLLAVTLHPVSLSLAHLVQSYMPASPELHQALARMLASSSLGEKLLCLALVPAVCEEIAFRGFLLAGLARKHPPGRAIVISSVLFGVFHMVPQQMVTASLLGLILGLIASRTGSILPGIAFHALHNSLGILAVTPTQSSSEPTIYPLAWIFLSALASALLIAYLIRMPDSPRDADV